MNTILYRAGDRGHARHGWLESYHSFSFGSFHNPDLMNFGALRVLNDDTVLPSYGFGAHPHDNMEIISLPLEGALEHKDSTGRQAIIRSGDVQMMSAGSGIEHSEKNASHSDPVKFLQIWIIPDRRGGEPVYQQITPGNASIGQWQTVVSPEAGNDAHMQIRQQAWLSLGTADSKADFDYTLKGERTGVYLMVLEGSATVNGHPLGRRDAIGVWNTDKAEIVASEGSRLLAIEVPMRF